MSQVKKSYWLGAAGLLGFLDLGARIIFYNSTAKTASEITLWAVAGGAGIVLLLVFGIGILAQRGKQ